MVAPGADDDRGGREHGEGEQHRGRHAGFRPDRNTEMAISGPNSPAAPIPMTAVPNGVRSSPASRRTGMIVPSAVLVSAIPMKTPAMTP